MKSQPTDWENIFANDVTDKGLVSKIYKQLMMFNSIKQTTRLKNGQKDSTDILQIKHQMANRHMKRCSATLIIKEMQIKITMKQHLLLARMIIIKNPQKTNAEQSVVRREPSYTVDGSVI